MGGLFSDGGAADAAAQQQKLLEEQKAAEKAKEDEAARQRMEAMKARIGGGFGINAGTPGGNPNATG